MLQLLQNDLASFSQTFPSGWVLQVSQLQWHKYADVHIYLAYEKSKESIA